jgi:hypothetical protein
MDIVLVFLTVLSAAIFQFVTALPYDPNSQSQLTLFAFFMRFSLKLLFLPFLVIIPMWLAMHIMQNENWRMFLRIMVWDLASLSMALNAVGIFVLGLSFNLEASKYPGIIFAIIIVGVAFGLAFWLDVAVTRAYGRALMMDPRQPAYNFFFRERWRYARSFEPLLAYVLWSAIIFAAVFL